MTSLPEFGHDMLKEFQLESGLTQFNNGSYGTVPLKVRSSRLEWLDKFETHPDYYLKTELDGEIEKVISKVGEYVQGDSDNLVFIGNATQGINIILRSLDWNKGDLVLCFTTTYPGVRILLDFLVVKEGIELVVVDHPPCTDEELIDRVQSTIDELEGEGRKVRLGVVDAITSIPGLLIPYEKISTILKRHGSLVAVDAAHAFGQIPLDLNSVSGDFLVTNLHKWGFSYRPTAILYAKPEVQSLIHLPIITFGYGSGKFKSTFAWPGTIDYTPWLSSSAALDFRHQLGDSKIRSYLHKLAYEGGQLVADHLHTSLLGTESQIPAMVNVLLPVTTTHPEFGPNLEQSLLKSHHMRTKIFHYHQNWYIRISAMIYLTLDDFKTLAVALETIIPKLDS